MQIPNALEFFQQIYDFEARTIVSKVTGLKNGIIRSLIPNAKIGSVVKILPPGEEEILAEIVGFDENEALLMPVSNEEGIRAGSKVLIHANRPSLQVSEKMIGRILDGYGRDLVTKEVFKGKDCLVFPEPISATLRYPIHKPIDIGIRSINGLITIGEGQRIGVFSGTGVGKSTLLGMIARNVKADINVICLVGERGRELREFVEKDLGEEGLKRSVVIISTSETCAVERLRCAYTAITIAEYFRDQNKNILFMMDSITRLAMAKREISLKLGEPGTSKGYTPSVFSELPKVIERCGTYEGRGSITGIFSVLVEGDEMDDPIADTTRGLLDGHIILKRSFAEKGIYPAVDPTQSLSRVMNMIVPPIQVEAGRKFRELMSSLKENEDLIRIGAYKPGNDPILDEAISKREYLESFLRQKVNEKFSFEESSAQLMRIVKS